MSLENLRRVGRALQPTTDLDQLADRHEFFDDHGASVEARFIACLLGDAPARVVVHGPPGAGKYAVHPPQDLRRVLRAASLAIAFAVADGAERVDVDGLCKAIAETTVAT